MRLTRIALAAILSLCSVVTTATDLSPDQAQSIWVLAWGQSHFIHKGDSTILFRPPVIHLMTEDQLCDVTERPIGTCANLKGAQRDTGVYLLRSLDFQNRYNASIVLHEMIHYIQYMTHGEANARDCAEKNRRERQARVVQANVLEKVGALREARMVQRTFNPARCS